MPDATLTANMQYVRTLAALNASGSSEDFMPFTPVHLGPGLAFKAIGGRNFSFMVFGGAQVLMDIEPLIGILRGSDVLHGYTHTILGALLIGAIAGFTGKPISSFALKWLKIPHHPFTWLASFFGAYLGTFSHTLLDAIMHSDMSPWWPIASDNNLLGIISLNIVHLLCVIAGVIGAIFCALHSRTRGRV